MNGLFLLVFVVLWVFVFVVNEGHKHSVRPTFVLPGTASPNPAEAAPIVWQVFPKAPSRLCRYCAAPVPAADLRCPSCGAPMEA